jgi:hypothetical protein
MEDLYALFGGSSAACEKELKKPEVKVAETKKPTVKSEFDNTNRGALFVNDKDGNDKRPDWQGYVKIDPAQFAQGDDGLVEIRLAAWEREAKVSGKKFLSVSASVPQGVP